MTGINKQTNKQTNNEDVLEVGVEGMGYEESKAHFSLWAIMASPLLLGNDLRNMTAQTFEIISNAEGKFSPKKGIPSLPTPG